MAEPVVKSPPTEPANSTPAAASSSPQSRRLGVLRCPNAASLGWGGRSATAAPTTQPSEEASASSPMATDGGDVTDIKNEPTNLKADDTRETPHAQVATDSAMDLSPTEKAHDCKQEVEVVSNDDTSSRKRPRLSDSIPTAQPTLKNRDAQVNGRDEGLGETEEIMKGGNNNAAVSTEPATNETKHLSVTLDYEPTSNESLERSQILTVTYDGGGSNANSSTVVGTISGRARIDLLPPLSDNDEMKRNPSTAMDLQPAFSLDVFGHRMSHLSNNDNANCSENNDSLIINRPDWMNSLPISVVCNNLSKKKGTPPVTLRIRIQSLTNENKKDSDSSGECYYSAYPQESYEVNLLPPNALYPGNYTAAGSGVCTILEPWKDTLDTITHEMMDSIKTGNTESKVDPLDDRNKTSGMDVANAPQQPTAPSLDNQNKILICGAKGVGKSTLLRYATNRIVSAPSSCNAATSNSSSAQQQYPRRVAILDLDCGQAELSPPGMLTLTVVSRPLLSDPPVHMVCGGSCDSYGRKIDAGVGQNQGEEDSVKHEAAYFFGDITSKADPDAYIQMATQLMQRYNELKELENQHGNSSLPLLVNTDGWVKGLGYEILSAIIGIVNPGHIVQIMGNTKAKSFDMSSHGISPQDSVTNGRHPKRPTFIHVTQSFDESLLPTALDDDNRSRRSIDSSSSFGPILARAADHRDHRLCAYFLGGHDRMMNLRSKIPGEKESISFHKERGLYDPNNVIGLTLASMAPYAVPFHSVRVYPSSGLLDCISDRRPLWSVQGNLACEDLIDSLNGSIVGLCLKPDALDMPLSSCNAGTGVPILNCVGLGIIRSIDHTRKLFFVLTPVHPRLLVNVTSFVGGNNITLPLECVYRGVHSDSFPFLSCGHTTAHTSIDSLTMKSGNKRGKK